MKKRFPEPDIRQAAVCGLFCTACTVFIGTREDPDRLKVMAERLQISVEELSCEGCRAENRSLRCQTCQFVSCAAEKGVDFCSECDEYPCEDLKEFQAAMPHRIELWDDLERIRDVGYEQWFEEKVERYSCPQCQTLNSAYDMTCRKCGADPGSSYVREHKQEIIPFLSKMK